MEEQLIETGGTREAGGEEAYPQLSQEKEGNLLPHSLFPQPREKGKFQKHCHDKRSREKFKITYSIGTNR